MARGYRAVCAQEPAPAALARLVTPVLRDWAGAEDEVVAEAGDRWRFGAATVVLRVEGPEPVRGRWRLEVVADRPEDEALALAMVVMATFLHDGVVVSELSRSEKQHRVTVSRLHHGSVTPRARLDALLAVADADEACARVREALAAGAPCEISDTAEPVGQWRSIFGRRERTSRRAGQGSVGFETALRALGTHPGIALTAATVDDRPDGGFWFQLFLTPGLTRIVACFGVARPRAREDHGRHPEAPTWTLLDEIVLGSHLNPVEKSARIVAENVPDVPAGIVAGLERHLATRHWPSFARYVQLAGAFPSPAAVRFLVDALDLARSDPYVHVVDVVLALSDLGPAEAVPALARTARWQRPDDFSADLALNAMNALLHIDTPESRTVLASLVDDDREPVRELAREVAEAPEQHW